MRIIVNVRNGTSGSSKKRGNDSTMVSWKTEFFQVRGYEMIKEAPVQPRGCAGIQSQLRKMAKKTR